MKMVLYFNKQRNTTANKLEQTKIQTFADVSSSNIHKHNKNSDV